MKHPAVTRARMILIISVVALLLPYGLQGLHIKDNRNKGVQEAAEEVAPSQLESNTDVGLLSKIKDRLRLMHIQTLEESKALLEKIVEEIKAELRDTKPGYVSTESKQEKLLLTSDQSPSRYPTAANALADLITKLNLAIEEKTDESDHEENMTEEADDIDRILQTISRGIKNPPGKRGIV